MPKCDVCSTAVSWEDGKKYSADEFRQIVEKGFEPDESMMRAAMMLGQSKQDIIAHFKNNTVATSTTDWLLCSSCSSRADKYINTNDTKAANPAQRSFDKNLGALDVLDNKINEVKALLDKKKKESTPDVFQIIEKELDSELCRLDNVRDYSLKINKMIRFRTFGRNTIDHLLKMESEKDELSAEEILSKLSIYAAQMRINLTGFKAMMKSQIKAWYDTELREDGRMFLRMNNAGRFGYYKNKK